MVEPRFVDEPLEALVPNVELNQVAAGPREAMQSR